MGYSALLMDHRTLTAAYKGKMIALTRSEWVLLEFLLRHRGDIVGRDELFYVLSGSMVPIKTRTVDVHLSSIRKKIAAFGDFEIRSKYGRGYALVLREN